MTTELSASAKEYLVRIKKNKWDGEAWTCLMNEIISVKIELVRKYYDKFFELFPTSGRFWKQYLHHEVLSNSPMEKINSIWDRCLLNCLSIELWEFYLKYVEDIGGISEECFKLAVNVIGYDINSHKIYLKYFTWLHQNCNDVAKIRKIYHQALNTPMAHVDKIWNLYEVFENQFSSHQTKSILTERQKKLVEATKKFHEKLKCRKGLLVNMLAVPFDNSEKMIQQKNLWKKLIDVEKRNSQRLDPKIIRDRVIFTFRQALNCMRMVPEMWYEYIQYLITENMNEEAEKVFLEALQIHPSNLLLKFAFLDFVEHVVKDQKRVLDFYKQMLKQEVFKKTLVYIHYLKFLDRYKGIKHVRKKLMSLLQQKEHEKHMTYHIYVCWAYLEFNKNNQKSIKLARGVFELGYKNFSDNPVFVNEYIAFLEHINDITSLRSLYERIFSVNDNVDGKLFFEIYNKYLKFEYRYGDVNTIEHVESKYFEMYPEQKYKSSIRTIYEKFTFMDLDPSGDEYERRLLDDEIVNENKEIVPDDVLLAEPEFIFTPSTEGMIQVSTQQLENMIKNPNSFSVELLNDPSLSAVAKVLPILPPLTNEQLPDLDIVLETLINGPLFPFEEIEQGSQKRGRKDENEIENNDIYAKRRKLI